MSQYFMLGTYFTVRRLAGGMIKVGDNSNGTMNAVCATVTTEQTDAGQLIELTCNAQGRYLSVELPGTNLLHFCEIEASVCSKFNLYVSILWDLLQLWGLGNGFTIIALIYPYVGKKLFVTGKNMYV